MIAPCVSSKAGGTKGSTLFSTERIEKFLRKLVRFN